MLEIDTDILEQFCFLVCNNNHNHNNSIINISRFLIKLTSTLATTATKTSTKAFFKDGLFPGSF